MATHSSILAWRIPWREEPSRLQSMGSQRVGHDLVIEQQQVSKNFKCSAEREQLCLNEGPGWENLGP